MSAGPILCRCGHGRLSHEGGDGPCGCGCPEWRQASLGQPDGLSVEDNFTRSSGELGPNWTAYVDYEQRKSARTWVPSDGPAFVLGVGVDVELGERVPIEPPTTPPRKPGVPWIGEDGRRRFICPACGGEYLSDPAISDEDREAEELVNLGRVSRDDRLSVCDDCYPVILERARAAGLID